MPTDAESFMNEFYDASVLKREAVVERWFKIVGDRVEATYCEAMDQLISPGFLTEMPSSLHEACKKLDIAAGEIVRGRDRLASIIKAWDVLKHGNYTRDIVETWLEQEMKPAIEAARSLALPSQQSLPAAAAPRGVDK